MSKVPENRPILGAVSLCGAFIVASDYLCIVARMIEETVSSDEYEIALKKGWWEVRRGSIVTAACLVIGGLATSFEFPLHNVLATSALVVGWVTAWRPIETFLYDLPEMRQNVR